MGRRDHSTTTAESGKRRMVLAGVAALAFALLTQLQPSPAGADTPSAALSPATKPRALEAYGKLPLAFVPNRGQTDARVRFSAQAGGASFWFTSREGGFALPKEKRSLNPRLRFLRA